MITQISIQDENGAVCLAVSHTSAEEIIIHRYGEERLGLSYSEARSLERALKVILSEALSQEK